MISPVENRLQHIRYHQIRRNYSLAHLLDNVANKYINEISKVKNNNILM